MHALVSAPDLRKELARGVVETVNTALVVSEPFELLLRDLEAAFELVPISFRFRSRQRRGKAELLAQLANQLELTLHFIELALVDHRTLSMRNSSHLPIRRVLDASIRVRTGVARAR